MERESSPLTVEQQRGCCCCSTSKSKSKSKRESALLCIIICLVPVSDLLACLLLGQVAGAAPSLSNKGGQGRQMRKRKGRREEYTDRTDTANARVVFVW